ncbi:hypothetical protein T484DRAFT_1797249 [Baffinella frigidus]|nr:hypothetical protein T484DRAFT_1797249 [Cryptophyta sp. CCMP2293]
MLHLGGYPCEEVTLEEAGRLEPLLSAKALAAAEEAGLCFFHFPQEGHADPVAATQALAAQAEALGVEMMHGVEVTGFPYDQEGDVKGIRYRPLAGGQEEEVRADVVVLANGTGVAQLAARAGVRVGVLTRSVPAADVRLSKIVVSPELHVLQRRDGRLSVGESKETGEELLFHGTSRH